MVRRGAADPGPAGEAPRGFSPRSRVGGALRPPGSKSIAQRALVAAALARGTTRIEGLPAGDDVARAARAVALLGAKLEPEPGQGPAPPRVAVTGRPGGWSAAGPVAAGESATLARLLTATAALAAPPGRPIEIAAEGTLLARGSGPLLRCLRESGVTVETLGARDDGWPLRLVPLGPPSALRLREPVSSQEVSGLLVALAALPGAALLRVEGRVPSRPYVDVTRAVLAAFGARVEARPAPGEVDAEELEVRGPLVAPDAPIAVEADASGAAVALAAACLSGGELRATGVGARSAQGDVAIVRHLRAFGCEAGTGEDVLWARGAPSRGAELELADHPDLAPPLAALAAAAALRGGRSRLAGLSALRGKESDRLAALADFLRRAGIAAEEEPDALSVGPASAEPWRPPEGGLVLDPRGDHRLAFAAALLGLLREGVLCARPGVCSKSWPDFWEALEALGAVPLGTR